MNCTQAGFIWRGIQAIAVQAAVFIRQPPLLLALFAVILLPGCGETTAIEPAQRGEGAQVERMVAAKSVEQDVKCVLLPVERVGQCGEGITQVCGKLVDAVTPVAPERKPVVQHDARQGDAGTDEGGDEGVVHPYLVTIFFTVLSLLLTFAGGK